MRLISKFFLFMFSLGVIGLLLGIGAVIFIAQYYSKDLPDYRQLSNYQPSIATRIHAGDGRLLDEYAIEKRVFVPINAIPQKLVDAFLAAEDKNFYDHPGIDVMGIARAVITNLQNIGSNRRPVGASTITQQVAKNFLLTNEVSIERKIKEALIAFRMEKAYSKDRILELYLNEIYLGRGTYGVAAAALDYFDKSLEDLNLQEMAYLAALPKAPNNYHPDRHHEEAVERRNWVLDRMAENGFITEEEAEQAKEKPLDTVKRVIKNQVEAEYFTEEVRREISDKYGEDALYEGGLSVRSSLMPQYQTFAASALINGLRSYDKRHGWRGPIKHFDTTDDWQTKLSAMGKPEGAKGWHMAMVLGLSADETTIGLVDGSKGIIAMETMRWARQWQKRQRLGAKITKPSDALSVGDVILVEKIEDKENTYTLQQIPEVQGGIVVMDPHTGRVLAMQGGYDYQMSEFNRATQARRQPGSAFKPFVYLAAMNNGFTPSHLVLDAPIVMDQGPGLPKWRPSNYSGDYYGLTPLRVGIEKSRNLMTVRLADHLGMDTIGEYAERFGIVDSMPPYISSALGSVETTLMDVATGYSMLVNGGKKITPTLIDRIQDREGKTVFRHDKRPCPACGNRIAWEEQSVPKIPDTRKQIADARTVYQIVSMLEGVVQRGTGVRAKKLGLPLGGKTGTTNDYKDAWFIGFTPDLVVATYIGFDEPSTLGPREAGSAVALPVFIDFMEEAKEAIAPTPFRIPEGLRLMRINPATGRAAAPGDEEAIWEAFIPGTEPSEDMLILDAEGVNTMPTVSGMQEASPTTGTGGLY